MNVVDPILYQCKLNPLGLALYVPGAEFGHVTYGALERFIYSVAASATNVGIAPGNVVATYFSNTVFHTVATLGLMHIGAATMSLRGPKAPAGIKVDCILTDVPGQVTGDVTVIAVDQSWLTEHAAAGERPSARGTGEDICRIILTSGSTGVSKGVALSHQTIADRTMSYTVFRGARFARSSRFFCDLALASSPGIHYALSLLGRGATIYFLGPDPADILQTIDLHKIDGMATSPYGLGEFLKFFEADTAFDVAFDHIICQGAMLSPELSRRARARMGQNLYVSYGATETSTVAFGPASIVEQIPGAVGYIQPGATIEATDKSGNVLPPMKAGVLRIRSHQMAHSYVGDPEASALQFRDGYFHTGDIGYITPEGLLVVTGREKTALNIGGDTVSAERVEDVIVEVAGIREAAVFALDNDLGIAELHALIVSDLPVDAAVIQRHCASKLPPSCTPVAITRIKALPRGGQGKIERHRLPSFATGADGSPADAT
jgi:acyl-coenzyme A synthetase/AMP-(fatty) acid ligase